MNRSVPSRVLTWGKFHLLPLGIIYFFAVLGILSLFHSGLYTAHDIWHQVARLYHYSQVLDAGQVFPLWVTNLSRGYGYPLFVFSYHFPWMLGAPLVLLGLPLFEVLKGLFAFGFVASGYTFYWFAYRLSKSRLAATVGAITYLWAPSHFLSVYVSASIGTVYVFTFMPLMALGIWLYVKEQKLFTGSVLFALSLVGGMLSHLITMVMAFPFLILWFILTVLILQPIKQKNIFDHLKFLTLSGGLTVGLSAFYLIPFVMYLPFTKANEMAGGLKGLYEKYFPTFKQLLYSKWGYGVIVEKASDGDIALQVGVVQWLAVFLFVLLFAWIIFRRRKIDRDFIFGGAGVAVYTLAIFFLLEFSKPLWKFANDLISLDYPFRLLLTTVFFGSVVVTWFLVRIKLKLLRLSAALLFVFIAWYTNRNHIRVNLYTDFSLQTYIDSEVTTNTYSEYSPKDTNYDLLIEKPPLALGEGDFKKPLSKDEQPKPRLNISDEKINGGGFGFTVNLPEKKTISLRQYVFPGVQTWVNNTLTEYRKGSDGLVTLDLQPGTHRIALTYIRPWWVKLSYVISFLTLFLIPSLLYFDVKNGKITK